MDISIHSKNSIICVRTEIPKTIAEILEENGFLFSKPCGGSGICGKCAIPAKGVLSPLTEKEKELLGKGLLHADERLACTTRVWGTVHIDYTTIEEKTQRQVQSVTRGNMPEITRDAPELAQGGYGMAVDIGTTTVAAYLYRFPEGALEQSCCYPNPQSAFGGDVISRIEYASRGGLPKLQQRIRSLIRQIQERFGKRLEKIVITGNTTMLHLLSGLDPAPLAAAPFRPQSLFGTWHENVYLPPCISAYVGADITCAILASGMMHHSCALLADIGTNGEIAFWDGKQILCCSTAAGPVFEGAGISQGMIAAEGAISKVSYQNGTYAYETIGDKEPAGVCGTGLIDMAACMLQAGVLEESGFLEKDTEIGDSGVYISKADIRQVQLAKAAVRGGIETILKKAGRSLEEIEAFYLCGGFGSYLRYDSCVEIGLVPPGLSKRVRVIGNAAGMGAGMILLSETCRLQAEEIAHTARTVELSSDPLFMELYCDNMIFSRQN